MTTYHFDAKRRPTLCAYCKRPAGPFLKQDGEHWLGALANDSDDAMSHRAEIRGASSITDSVRWAIAMWLASAEDCERICEEMRVKNDRMAVVKAALVKSNSGNVDYETKTLFRKDGVLELLEEVKNPIHLYDKF